MPRRRSTSARVVEHDRGVLDRHFADRYQELRRIAAGLKRNDPGVTINPTALVNEAWLRLSGASTLGALSVTHFKALAARAMRRVLIDEARRRHAQKRARGAGVVLISPGDLDEIAPQGHEDVLALDEALDELARLEPRQASVVEGRYFGGLTAVELASLHGVSPVTVERDWRVAKAFLKARLRRQ